ncbi:hypothetical protein AKJ40_00740 [candidate division MSBL1 archaeon SCGC-AAA259M10]|uniref:Uncharacterized protein n=1 Tax=candidate division MSBL1 archaeon SCGC-AAA259M10 TaxID=1698270 RepID=A0A133V2Q5_9EURY|nr:hypothetical protein AKJ40_00740 [candidate division MSBL1 archaeon SCGC-AAA259M10]
MSENHKEPSLKEKAKEIQSARNEKWGSAWGDWHPVSFVDHAIAKVKRAHNVLGDEDEVEECLIDTHNYLNRLKEKILKEEIERDGP